MLKLMSLVLVSLIGLSAGVQAQNNWSAPGSVCVPTGASIRAGKFDTNQAAVIYSPGSLGEIFLHCAIARFNSATAAYDLKITYRDSTGTATTGSVRAVLLYIPITGATPVILGSVTSDSSAVTTLNSISSAAIAHTFDFEANIYWVRVVLKRTATDQIVIFHNAWLDGFVI